MYRRLSSPLGFLAHLLCGVPLVFPHLPLVAFDPLDALPPSIGPDAGALFPRGLLLRVNLDQPVVLALLVQALVTPLALPLARLLVVGQVAALLPGLCLDALLGGEALPLGRRLGLGHGFLAGQAGGGRGQRQEDAVAGGLERAGGEELVDERLGAVAGDLGEGLVDGGAVEDDGVGVLGEEVAEVEGVGRGLVDDDGELWFGDGERHCVEDVRIILFIWYIFGY